MKKWIVFALGIAALALQITPAFPQGSWPSKPVRFVVPSSSGGGTDVYARMLAQVLIPVFGTPGAFAASLKKERDGRAEAQWDRAGGMNCREPFAGEAGRNS